MPFADPYRSAQRNAWASAIKPRNHRMIEDLQNRIEVYEMLAKLYRFIPW